MAAKECARDPGCATPSVIEDEMIDASGSYLTLGIGGTDTVSLEP
jgi:hypothetical protein